MIDITGRFEALGRPIPQVVSLLVQRQIVEDEIECRAPRLDAVLDVMASRATIVRELSPADASYLRGLKSATSPLRGAPNGHDGRTIPLPARLIAQIDESLVLRALRIDRLSQAIKWEAAALVSGKSMFEWAALGALQNDVR